MSQWDYKIDQPMPGPFPFPNSRKGPGIEVDTSLLSDGQRSLFKAILLQHVLPLAL